MRTTGVIVAVIGLMIALFCGVTAAGWRGANVPGGGGSPGLDLTVPLIFAVGAMVAGVLMYAFGGRTVWYIRNPAIRN